VCLTQDLHGERLKVATVLHLLLKFVPIHKSLLS
jgi:hypothetical protein